jgi:hypothetical protein
MKTPLSQRPGTIYRQHDRRGTESASELWEKKEQPPAIFAFVKTMQGEKSIYSKSLANTCVAGA